MTEKREPVFRWECFKCGEIGYGTTSVAVTGITMHDCHLRSQSSRGPGPSQEAEEPLVSDTKALCGELVQCGGCFCMVKPQDICPKCGHRLHNLQAGVTRPSAPADVPCLGSWTHTSDGDDFDCGYLEAGGFDCGDCVVNGGRMDPRTGKAYRASKRST